MFHNISLLGFVGIPMLIIGVFFVLIFIFELLMFINAIRNTTISDNRKILWIIGMLFVHPFVAIAYYFTDYKNNKFQTKNNQKTN